MRITANATKGRTPMLLSQTSEHALRALLYLAGTAPAGPVPAERIAEALGAPANYLGKTLQLLARARLVEGLRGPTGGYRLVAEPDRISVADVVRAVAEPEQRRTVCLLGDRPCDEAHPCGAHERWTALAERTQALLRQTTLLDLLGSGSDAARPEPSMAST